MSQAPIHLCSTVPAAARTRLACVLVTVCCLALTACDNISASDTPGAPTDSALADMQQQLQGTWLREYGKGGVQARRLLVLEADNTFTEQVRVVDAGGNVSEHRHAGTWLYDGTNLKRKYTAMDGKPPSRLNLPFATFEVRFESRNEFTGLDRVHNNQVRYSRVAPETAI